MQVLNSPEPTCRITISLYSAPVDGSGSASSFHGSAAGQDHAANHCRPKLSSPHRAGRSTPNQDGPDRQLWYRRKPLRGDYDRANRGETRVFVSHGPGKAERDVVSVLAGYRYKKQSEVDFSIDKKSATLFTLDNRAWSQGPEDDMRLVAAMKRGSKLIVTGVSSRNNKTIDEYSLSGFTAAKNFLDKACP